jgi:citrate synthase
MFANNYNKLDPKYSLITEEIEKYAEICENEGIIEPELYKKYKVNRGLRDLNGNGVLTGLTEISEINAFRTNEEGEKVPIEGELLFRGYNVNDLVKGLM